MLRLIACDWNGTLFRQKLEEAFFIRFCQETFFRAVRRMQIGRVASLGFMALRCYRRYFAAKLYPAHAPTYIGKTVDVINEKVFRGTPCEELNAYVAEYARRIQPRLERRLLEPLRRAREQFGVPLGIVSLGCRPGIAAALDLAGCPFDFVLANDFEMDGDVVEGFRFEINENKADVLSEYLTSQDIDPADVMYIGDSPQDEGCLQLVGMPVLSFWATDEHKRRFARDHRAFVPRTVVDFEGHIRSLLASG